MHDTNNKVKLCIRVQCHVLRPPDPLTVTMSCLHQTVSTKPVSCQTSMLLSHISKTYNSLDLANFMVQCILYCNNPFLLLQILHVLPLSTQQCYVQRKFSWLNLYFLLQRNWLHYCPTAYKEIRSNESVSGSR